MPATIRAVSASPSWQRSCSPLDSSPSPHPEQRTPKRHENRRHHDPGRTSVRGGTRGRAAARGERGSGRRGRSPRSGQRSAPRLLGADGGPGPDPATGARPLRPHRPAPGGRLPVVGHDDAHLHPRAGRPALRHPLPGDRRRGGDFGARAGVGIPLLLRVHDAYRPPPPGRLVSAGQAVRHARGPAAALQPAGLRGRPSATPDLRARAPRLERAPPAFGGVVVRARRRSTGGRGVRGQGGRRLRRGRKRGHRHRPAGARLGKEAVPALGRPPGPGDHGRAAARYLDPHRGRPVGARRPGVGDARDGAGEEDRARAHALRRRFPVPARLRPRPVQPAAVPRPRARPARPPCPPRARRHRSRRTAAPGALEAAGGRQ